MRVRNIQGEDYVKIHSVLNDWWGGRDMAAMLPKLFFIHFQETSFIIEEEELHRHCILISLISLVQITVKL